MSHPDRREVLYEELKKKIDTLAEEWDLLNWDIIAALTLLNHVYLDSVIQDAREEEEEEDDDYTAD